MRIVDDPKDLSAPDLCGCGFVPTMGALHEGHGSLVRRAAADGRPVVVSIFVNPTQFGPSEDYARYPRTLDSDCALLEPLGVAAVFVPSVEAIYPRGLEAARTEAAATELPEVATRPQLEDACRPTHFGGVALVVGRLFDLVRPGRAYFGEKDYQQLRLIEDMVDADRGRYGSLEIVPCPTIRERDGLAMSSRNRYLAPEQRDAALALSRALQIAHSAQRVATAERLMRDTLDAHGLETEYAVVRDARTLMPVTGFERPTRALIAVRLGSTRLIDNAPMTVWR
jgi:pantoate--beta-alanine ligase